MISFCNIYLKISKKSVAIRANLRLIVDQFTCGGIVIGRIKSCRHNIGHLGIAQKQVGTVATDHKVEISVGIAYVDIAGVGIYGQFARSGIAVVVDHSFLGIVLHN